MKLPASFLLILFVALVGCVSKPPEPVEEVHSPRLGIAQNSDGVTTMSWESNRGYYYTIFYQEIRSNKKKGRRSEKRGHSAEEVLHGFLQPDQEGNSWRELRSVTRVRGTGRTMTVSDRVNPYRGVTRRYRLHFEKPQATRSF